MNVVTLYKNIITLYVANPFKLVYSKFIHHDKRKIRRT